MTLDLTRRQWLTAGTAVAGSMLASNLGLAQTITAINTNPTRENPIRCNFNENVYGTSLKAKAAMLAAFDKAHLYDFGVQRQLKKVIAEMENIAPENVACGNGSTPFIEKAAYVAHMNGGAVLAAYPTYNNVVRRARDIGAKVIEVPVNGAMEIDLEAMRNAMSDEVKVVYLANPNNPIPTIIEKNALRDFCLEMSKRALVIVDEAYYEYVDNPAFASMVDLVVDNKNIIIARTASKIHAMAGIRIGFAFAHPETLKTVAAGFNLAMNYISMQGAIASYQDTEYQAFVKKKNKQALEVLYKMFAELDLPYIKSNSNFTFFNAGRPANDVRERLMEFGIMTGREFRPFTNWVRLSTAKPEEMNYVTEVYKREFG